MPNGFDASARIEREFGPNPAGCRDRQVNTAPADSFQPNGFGLYDVLGNVEEWVDDCWNDSYAGAPSDGTSWYAGDCDRRIARGGSFYDPPEDHRSGYHNWTGINSRVFDRGFRVARTIS